MQYKFKLIKETSSDFKNKIEPTFGRCQHVNFVYFVDNFPIGEILHLNQRVFIFIICIFILYFLLFILKFTQFLY